MSDKQTEAVGLGEVNSLRRAGVISVGQYLDAVYLCREPEFWTRWALRALLALGVGHLLAGIVFFFAYNWNSLTPVVKFAILQGGILTTAVTALIVRLDRIAGQVLLIATTVLVGTLLAVIGQVYQAGANAYELFASWALLTVPLVVASRSATHWFVWLVIAYTAFTLYEFQVLLYADKLSYAEFLSLLAVITVAILVAREGAVRIGARWLGARWTRLLLVFAAILAAFAPAIHYVLESRGGEIIALLTFTGITLAIAIVYFRKLPDFSVLAITTGFVSLFLMAVGWRVLDETIGFEWSNATRMVSFLALQMLWCAAMTGSAVKLLAILHRRMESGGGDD